MWTSNGKVSHPPVMNFLRKTRSCWRKNDILILPALLQIQLETHLKLHQDQWQNSGNKKESSQPSVWWSLIDWGLSQRNLPRHYSTNPLISSPTSNWIFEKFSKITIHAFNLANLILLPTYVLFSFAFLRSQAICSNLSKRPISSIQLKYLPPSHLGFLTPDGCQML